MPSEESIIHLTEEFQDLGFEYINSSDIEPSDAISEELLRNLLQMPKLYGTIIENISAPYDNYYFLSLDEINKKNDGAEEDEDNDDDDEINLQSRNRMSYVPVTKRYTPTFFKPGRLFSGFQECADKKYPSRMEILSVDIFITNERTTVLTPHFTGTLTIENLGPDVKEIKTYFEGYIINYKQFGLFSSEWADEPYLRDYICGDHIDLIHWGLFPPFSYLFRDCFVKEDAITTPLLNIATIKENIVEKCKRIKEISEQRYLFMKLKEKFFIPEEVVVKNISHDGLYYLCHDQQEGNIFGFYHSNRGEVYQRLDINPIIKPLVEEGNSSFEFN
ncbi:hypothetical protein RNJ44_02078 [Nakaseomyces bracarensis]|uniref:Uncharacterized protein n=1 Tax=Nakaseomyces bracarensis TaxID=273131 RepID=A0ABR4NMF2_9SACH